MAHHASICDDLAGEESCSAFWQRAAEANAPLKTKLTDIGQGFLLTGNVVMEDLYVMDEVDMQVILSDAHHHVKFSAMIIRLLGGRYKGELQKERLNASAALGLKAITGSSGGFMEQRYKTSPGAPLPVPALTQHLKLTAPNAPAQTSLARRSRSATGWSRRGDCTR